MNRTPAHLLRLLENAKHKHFVERSDGGPGFWEISEQPIQTVATEILRSAIRAFRPALTVVSSDPS